MALLLALFSACAPPEPRFTIVHHRANGCDSDAPENSLAAVRCVAASCRAGGFCALEIDVRVVRVRGGSLGGDLEAVILHDGTTTRTARCPAGELSLPGDAPVDAAALAACRLLHPDGAVSEDPLPLLADALDALSDAPVTLFLELKTAADEALDRALVDAVAAALRGRSAPTVLASFDRAALDQARTAMPGVPTACFVPSGGPGRQMWSAISAGLLADADACLAAGHDFVFIPPGEIDERSVAAHVRTAGRKLGIFGADTADGHDAVAAHGDTIDVVYADHPAMYRR